MKLQLLAVDLDGTLLRDDKSFDIQRFKEVKQGLIEDGTLVCIATGNSYHKIADYFDAEAMENVYFAVDNGNHLVYNGQTLMTQSIDYTDMLSIVDYLHTIDQSQIVISTSRQSYFIDHKDELSKVVRFYNPNLNEIQDFTHISKEELIYKIALITQHSLTMNKTLVNQIKQKFTEIQCMTSASNWIDIISKDGGKGAALQYLERQHDIDLAQTIGFGDSLNDLTMMMSVGYSVAMGNADPDLVKHCRYQIGNNNDQSVLSTLEDYLAVKDLRIFDRYRIH